MKRALTDCIPEDVVYRLTEEAFEAPAAGEKRGRTFPRILALAASLAIVVTLLNFDTVYAAVRELLYFIPGGGPVGQEEDVSYWLPDQEYSAEIEDETGVTRYFVTYLYRRGDTLSIQVEKEYQGKIVRSESYDPDSQKGGIIFVEEETKGITKSVFDSDGRTEPFTDEEKAKMVEERARQLAGESRSAVDYFEEAPSQEEPYSHPEYIDPPESRPNEAINLPAAPKQSAAYLGVTFLDENGTPVELEHSAHNASMALGEGELEASEELELSGFTLEKFTLELDGRVRFPVELHQVDLEDYALTRGVTVEDAGYSVSLLPLNSNCTRFALIPTPVGEQAERVPKGSYWNPLSFDIEAIGEDGTVYEAESVNSRPGCQEYYISGLPETKITKIILTGILENTRYKKSPASIKLPALAMGEIKEMNQEIDLGNITLTIKAAGLTEKGQLWVKIDWGSESGCRLNQINLDWPRKNQSEGYSLSHSLEGSSQTIEADNMEWRAGKKTTLPVTFVSVVQEGRWEFEVPDVETKS